jgi:hypothetical protein
MKDERMHNFGHKTLAGRGHIGDLEVGYMEW